MKKFDPTKILKRKVRFFILIYVLILSSSVFAADAVSDKTFSPYFMINSTDPSTSKLPLQSTDVKAHISGVIADVTVTQTYSNTGDSTIEAIYVFPASTRAAVYAMTMTIGERVLVAKIAEKEQARKEYEEAKEEGRTASLLEQERPNVFQMNVANILPGDTIQVELKYTELLIPVDNVYEFVYPTVVGPRYTGESQPGTTEWNENVEQQWDENMRFDFSFETVIQAGMPLKEVYCSSHPNSVVSSLSNTSSMCRISGKDEAKKDIILKYRLAGDEIETGLLLYEGDEENFFLAMMQPPQRPDNDNIPPREYVLIMDVSGSMNGYPIDVSKELMRSLLNDLRAYEKFNIVFFESGNNVLSEYSLNATPKNIALAIDMVEKHNGSGGTNLLSALKTAMNLKGAEDYARTFIIATDGYVSVEKEAFDYVRENLNEASFFAFGIGDGVNRYIIEGLSYVGQGEPFIATNQSEANEMAELFREYIEAPVLTNISIDYNGFEAYDVEPVSIPDVFAQRPVLVYGKYKGNASGNIEVLGLTGGNDFQYEFNVANYSPNDKNSALRYLWARKKIAMLDEYSKVAGENNKEEVTELGLKYNLLTNYTSFIAVDTITRTTDPGYVDEGDQNSPFEENDGEFAAPTNGAWDPGKYVVSIADNLESNNENPGSSLVSIYPNPVVEEAVLNFLIDTEHKNAQKQIYIYDVFGRLVHTIDISEYTAGNNELKLNLHQIGVEEAGIYIIKLVIDGKMKNKIRFNVL